MKKSMENMQSEMKRENLELRRQVEEMSHDLPTGPGLEPSCEYVWTERDKAEEINRILTNHERNRYFQDRANIICDWADHRSIVAQVVQTEGTHSLW